MKRFILPSQLSNAARLFGLAFVLAAFPFLFLLDQNVESGLSPVLPGLAVLIVVGAMTPLIILEWWRFRLRNKDDIALAQITRRRRVISRTSVTISMVGVIVWLAWGV